ncbi:phospholipase A2 [Streptomyces spectabilis]|nr:phospholipase A2 [Streptomyces spectabilis]
MDEKRGKVNKVNTSVGGALLAGVIVATSALPAVADSAPAVTSADVRTGSGGAIRTQTADTLLPMVSKAKRLKVLKSLTSKGERSVTAWYKHLGKYQTGSNKYKFVWKTDYCSGPATEKQPGGYDFSLDCHRHDFGYRNYKKYVGGYGFKKYHRKRIDDVFLQDMRSECKRKFWGDPLPPALRKKMRAACNKTAKTYYDTVRTFGHL